MQIEDVVQVQISLADKSPSQVGFGIPLVVGFHTLFPERVRSFTSLDELTDLGFDTDSAIYRAARAMLIQTPTVDTFKVGRLASTPSAEIYELTPVLSDFGVFSVLLGDTTFSTAIKVVTPSAVNSTEYTVTIAGTEYSFTSDASATAAEIVTGLIAAINVDAASHGVVASGSSTLILTLASGELEAPVISLGTNLATAAPTATQVGDALRALINASDEPVTAAGTTTILLTADVAGDIPDIAPSSNLTLQTTGPVTGPDFAADLTAIRAEDDEWYALVFTGHSLDEIRDASVAIESTKKILLAITGDASVASVSAVDVGSVLEGLGHNRTALFYSRYLGQYLNAANAGDSLPFDPGEKTWALSQIEGLNADDDLSSSQEAFLRAKNVNWLSTVSGLKVMSNNGVMTSGRYIDLQVYLDYIEARVKETIFGYLVSLPKVPFTDVGIQGIRARLLGFLGREGPDKIVPGSIVVTVPLRVNTNPVDRAARFLDGVEINFDVAGAIQSVSVRVRISQ